jgi:hypothetical protein
MADHPEVIRQQMEETRSQLADKLEKLENQVSDTVQSTTEAVTDTVEAVKETVENVTTSVKDTVQNVSEAFDLGRQTERHPWIVFGASVAVGCLAAQLFGGQAEKSLQRGSRQEPYPVPPTQPPLGAVPRQTELPAPPPAQAESSQNGKKSWFWEELGKFKGLAVGAVMGVVRDLARKGIPGQVGERLAEEVDHLTTNLGGEPIHGPVLPTNK